MISNREDPIVDGVARYLPPGWEMAFDSATSRYFYVDHNTKTTTWLNPMNRWTQPKSPSECYGEQLPYGWERLKDPLVGVYYANHLERRNQWSNPVTEWQHKMSLLSQHHYSNSNHVIALQQNNDGHTQPDSDNQTTASPATADASERPETSLPASDIEKSATSLNNSTTLDTEIVDSIRSNNSTRSKFDASLIDIMDSCFGRNSGQSVEV